MQSKDGSIINFLQTIKESQIVADRSPFLFHNKTFNIDDSFLDRVTDGKQFGTIIGIYDNRLYINIDNTDTAIPINNNFAIDTSGYTEFANQGMFIDIYLGYYLRMYGTYYNSRNKYNKNKACRFLAGLDVIRESIQTAKSIILNNDKIFTSWNK